VRAAVHCNTEHSSSILPLSAPAVAAPARCWDGRSIRGRSTRSIRPRRRPPPAAPAARRHPLGGISTSGLTPPAPRAGRPMRPWRAGQ
jgi:hypothetical protein